MAEEIIIFSRTGVQTKTVSVVDKSESIEAKQGQKADASIRRISLRQQRALAAYLSGNL